METPIKGYKILNHDLTCRGYQFEIGKLHEHEGDIELCKSGFHFCKYPSGVWAYYTEGRVFEVEAWGVLPREVGPGANYKMVASKIRLVREIEVGGDQNTGHGNTGDRNTGHWNTGDRNTGDWNTGDQNTGNGNAGSFHTGFFCSKPVVRLWFDKPYKGGHDAVLAEKLAYELTRDAPFDYAAYATLPNATVAKIKKLHCAHIEARKAK